MAQTHSSKASQAHLRLGSGWGGDYLFIYLFFYLFIFAK